MDINTRCLVRGAAPYGNVKYMTTMMAKLFNGCPSLMLLPKVSENENLAYRTLVNIPGIIFEEKKVCFTKRSLSKFKEDFESLEEAYLNPAPENLTRFGFESAFLEKFLQIVKKFKSPNAIVPMLGPFTIAEILSSGNDAHLLADKDFRKLLIYSLCVKSFWIISKIKEYSPATIPVILFEEPALNKLGDLKRENESITAETVTSIYSKSFDKIKSMGALTCIQSFGKCDWSVPIKAGADIISFDAYNNPSNLTVIPEIVSEYLTEGGMINWAIVPSHSENIVKNAGIDALWSRLTKTFEELIISGVPRNLVYKSAIVSVNGDIDKLPVIFAEKACILSSQLASKLNSKFI